MTHAGAPEALSHHNSQQVHANGRYGGISASTVFDEQAHAAPVANDSSMPLGLSAIGVSLLTIAAMLGVRIRRGLQQSTSSGGHESDMSVALAPTSADAILELKTQHSTSRSNGWSQQSSNDSRPTTLCYATEAASGEIAFGKVAEAAGPAADFFVKTGPAVAAVTSNSATT